MIRINLLPLEKRRAERTPFPRFMLIVATAAAAAIVLAVLAYILVIKRPGLQAEIGELTQRQKDLAPAVREHKKLSTDLAALEAKLRDIDSVITRNVEMWRAVDAVWQVVDNTKKIWLDEIRLMEQDELTTIFRKAGAARTAALPEYALRLDCHAAGADGRDLVRFREGLKEHPYLLAKFEKIDIHPQWETEEEEDYQAGHSMAFVVTMWPQPKVVQQAPARPPARTPAKPPATR